MMLLMFISFSIVLSDTLGSFNSVALEGIARAFM